jgi:hypothetical protein
LVTMSQKSQLKPKRCKKYVYPAFSKQTASTYIYVIFFSSQGYLEEILLKPICKFDFHSTWWGVVIFMTSQHGHNSKTVGLSTIFDLECYYVH